MAETSIIALPALPQNVARHTSTILIVVVMVLVIGAFYWAYHSGQKSITQVIPPPDNPGPNNNTQAGGQGGQQNNPYGSSVADVKMLATDIYNDATSSLKSMLGTHDEDIYKRALELSDTDFVSLYNAYNVQYQADSGKSMAAAVKSIWGGWNGGGFATTQSALEDRFSRLGLV